jgi:thioredoxin 1
MREVNANEVEEFIQKEGLTVLDLHAIWCAPCRMLKPRLEALSEEYGDIEFLSMDVDKNEAFAQKFAVRSIPTLLFFKGGELVRTVVGVPTEKTLAGHLEAHR